MRTLPLATFFLLFAALTLKSTVTSAAEGRANSDRPPNIVILFMDDMGYADIGPFGAEGYETPHLDQMAREGRRFTDFYVTQAVCSSCLLYTSDAADE